MLQDYYNRISGKKKLLIKAGILYGALLTTAYLIFRAYYINFTLYLAPFSILLYLAELHTLILIYAMLYSLWPRKYKVYADENKNKNLQINLFIPTAGEPTEVVRETIVHAQKAAIYYERKINPFTKPRVIVLNDGKGRGKENWIEIKDICERLGVYHIARDTNEGFKAGNINNGIKEFPSADPHNTIDCFFDADFCAKEDFLVEILKPLTDNEVDFVQSPQRYKNLNTWVANAAAAHQIFFFDYICPAKAYDNALFLCGTNYAIRRQALLDTEGVDNRFVTEDYATSIKLHLQGKKGVFVSKVLAEGMAPMTLKEYFNQQTRWCKGCLDANGAYLKELLFGPLNIRQKFHYFFSTAYYFIGIRDAILVLAPIPYLFYGISLIRANTIQYLAFIYLPLVIYNFILFFLTFRNPIKSLVLDVVSFPVFAKAFLSSVVGKNLPFTITIKKYEKENPFAVYKTQLFVALMLVIGLIYSFYSKRNVNVYGAFINHFWASYDAFFLLLGFWLVARENYNLSLVENNFFKGLRFAKTNAVKPAFIFIVLAMVGLFAGYKIKTGAIAYADYRVVINQKVEDVQNFNKRAELLIPQDGIFYGYYLPELNNHPLDPKLNLTEYDKPSLTMYYQDWNESSKFNKAYMNRLWKNGVIPVVTWEPWDTQNLNSEINKNGNPQRLINDGVYDDYIRAWAKEAKDFNKPFFLRFAHEMNGNWYPWGNFDKDSSYNYVRMWVHVHKIFEEERADNVIWVWSPNNTNQYAKLDGVLDFYPGVNYVDWVAFSAFNWGNAYENNIWRDFKTISWPIYSELSTLKKPIMVAETSSVSAGGDKEKWFRETLQSDIPSMPNIKAVILFNENYGKADFKLDSGMDSGLVIMNDIVDNGYYLTKPVVVYR